MPIVQLMHTQENEIQYYNTNEFRELLGRIAESTENSTSTIQEMIEEIDERMRPTMPLKKIAPKRKARTLAMLTELYHEISSTLSPPEPEIDTPRDEASDTQNICQTPPTTPALTKPPPTRRKNSRNKERPDGKTARTLNIPQFPDLAIWTRRHGGPRRRPPRTARAGKQAEKDTQETTKGRTEKTTRRPTSTTEEIQTEQGNA